MREQLLCQCVHVSEARLRRAWDAGARDVPALKKATGACGGCGTCEPQLRRLVRRWTVLGWLGR